MKKIFFSLFNLIVFSVFANDGKCITCEKVRAYNEEHKSSYEFYEDYLKDKEAGKAEEIRYPGSEKE